MIHKSRSKYAIWIKSTARSVVAPAGKFMTEIWTAAVTLAAGMLGAFVFARSRRARRERHAALGPGDLVFVTTPDRKRLIARVIARGKSHFWIELTPGDARWWVPATAVEAVPEDVCERFEGYARISRITRRLWVARGNDERRSDLA